MRFAVRGPGAVPPAAADAHAICDVLWAHARPWWGLEHVRTRAEAGHVDVAVLLRTGPVWHPGRLLGSRFTTREMWNRSLARSPRFRTWEMVGAS